MFRLTCGDELVCFLPLHTRLRVRPASGIPCALLISRDTNDASLGHVMPRECGGVHSCRHCERSEAIHATTCDDMDCFVASLLAMTKRLFENRNQRRGDRRVGKATASAVAQQSEGGSVPTARARLSAMVGEAQRAFAHVLLKTRWS